MAKRILTVGYAEMKLYLPVEALASEYDTLRGLGSVSYAPSGHGGNAAVTFAQNGLESVLVSAIGRDPHGETLYGFYKEKGVSLSSLRVLQDKPTALCAVLRDQTGKEKHALYEGASSALTVSCLEKAFNLCPDALYMSLELPEEILRYGTDYAYRHGIPVFLDGAGLKKGFALSRLSPVTVFSPNEEEARLLSGIDPLGTEACISACLELSKQLQSEYIVLKLGERGAFVCHGRHFEMIPPYTVRKRHYDAVGDAFTASLAAHFVKTGNMAASARFATAAAALTLGKEGDGFSIPTEAEVLHFMEHHQE